VGVHHFDIYHSSCLRSRRSSLQRKHGYSQCRNNNWAGYRRGRADKAASPAILVTGPTHEAAHGPDLRLCVKTLPCHESADENTSVRRLPYQTLQQYRQNIIWSSVCRLEVSVLNDHPQSSNVRSSSMKLYNKHHGTLSRSVV
jgi:hypothetical protein